MKDKIGSFFHGIKSDLDQLDAKTVDNPNWALHGVYEGWNKFEEKAEPIVGATDVYNCIKKGGVGNCAWAAAAVVPGGKAVRGAKSAEDIIRAVRGPGKEAVDWTGKNLHLALGHSHIPETNALRKFAAKVGAETWTGPSFRDIWYPGGKFNADLGNVPKMINRVVQSEGRISFNLKGADIDWLLDPENSHWTSQELKYVCKNPAARAITKFAGVDDAPC